MDEKSQNLAFFICYNCDTEIIDDSQQRCPNCGVILHPNDYIKWARSWWGCLLLLIVTPLIIGFIIGYLL
ncbi:MAG: hypothetical protein ACTSR8_17390 [Promethearchaeota archaeon]